ncbi:hypothetical protein PsalN5692_02991 [Piscirickettsia salmonis]|uniref:YchJ family protein n=1 Tax=Piscirickettsia salmonis TaxID=1238 RepID=UPI001E55C290|nr:YchJ family metal-binding protein [Piscirickettsia salmonis]QGP51507.1 hypothetical protein PsalN5692_02991 [Piscirickettsia salmonis]QGP53307.1 hypothetical protein PsalSR1_00715 [Piscirickettsia salmonis]QGP60772.1 hypothetical protein PsalBI1_03393 [Piscirickettsia salmonis]QGP62872.1 hypothetical protein PsalMR5_00713 [Piscirickettsia salmonis]
MPELCPCCSQKPYSSCCQPFVSGQTLPATPEQLMRSRYTAYTQANIDYIIATMQGEALNGFNRNSATTWAKQSTWLNLQVLSAPAVRQDSQEGFVEFIASLQNQGKIECLHEKSRFIKNKDQWFYVDGQQH